MTRTRRTMAVWASILLCLSWLSGCARCGERDKGPALAAVTTINGAPVERDYADALHAWERAVLGSELRLGDGARTGRDATAELTFINGARLALSEATTVRLLADVLGDGGSDETGLDIETGSARLRAGARAISLRTHVGLATIAPSSEVLLTRDGPALGFDVAFGTLSFREKEGETSLGAGDSMRVGIGMAVMELNRQKPPEPASHPLIVEIGRGEIRVGEGEEERVLRTGTHELSDGTQLRLPAKSEARLARGPERATLFGPGEFVVGGATTLVDARRGTLVLEARERDVAARVPAGFIVARENPDGSRARIALRPNDGVLSVERGQVDATLDGKNETLREGSQRTWGYGANTVTRGPDYHNLLVGAGQSFTVHAPSVPVAIGFDFAKKCEGEAQLELLGKRQKSRAQDSANLLLGPGVHKYTVRCINKSGLVGRIVSRGSVNVMVDSGTRKLPPRAPTSYVEADGRTYTIYYQNQLPEVVVRWPQPPKQPRYHLLRDGELVTIEDPSYRFKSGDLTDGSHTVSFLAEGRRSRTTTVVVRFDNAAPKASLTSPADRGFVAGDVVQVEGLALPNWKVAIVSGNVSQGAGDRFTGQVQTTKAQPDIAVRLSHPRLGTHYYLRRAQGSP